MRAKLTAVLIIFAIVIIGSFVFLYSNGSDINPDENVSPLQNTTIPTSESSNVAGRVSHNLVLTSPAKESVETVMVYKTVPPVVNKEVTLEYAKKFNVTGKLRDNAVVQSEDLRFGVEISKNSGRVIYIDQDRPNENQDAPQYLPSDEEAIEIATKFLKEKDLYPDGAVNPSVERENAYTVGKGDEVYFSQIGVWYHRYLNGLKVKGTQLVVYVGGGGDVIGYYANWRDYEPYKEYPVVSSGKAFESLKSRGVSVGMNSQDSLVSFDEVYLAYQTTAGAYSEDYLEPVWVFKGNVMNEDNKAVTDVVQYIPALAKEPTELISK
ncbi:hypothetical protein J2128_000393 [Methanomicrobium sp. W14]|uniref:hypothetical protein n=1 Tax=Methanomicrobium sp. W14 TaxID=2817839 RepID=UPI001AEAA48B|nr:hypothetical protein [Methanomicrobium sp. W14]MBP2132472.1 hypothetical protein [Methanomicrobium sp. W14]